MRVWSNFDGGKNHVKGGKEQDFDTNWEREGCS